MEREREYVEYVYTHTHTLIQIMPASYQLLTNVLFSIILPLPNRVPGI